LFIASSRQNKLAKCFYEKKAKALQMQGLTWLQ
jgi:hypothetical protein